MLLGQDAPAALEDATGNLARVLQCAVGLSLEVCAREVDPRPGARQAHQDLRCLTLVSAQDEELLARAGAELANPVSRVCLDLLLRSAERAFDLGDRLCQLRHGGLKIDAPRGEPLR